MDSGSVVRPGETINTITIHNQGQTDIELTTGDGEETDWIRDIRNHIQDCGDWHQAAPGQMEILSPSRKVGGLSQTVNILILIFVLRRWRGGR